MAIKIGHGGLSGIVGLARKAGERLGLIRRSEQRAAAAERSAARQQQQQQFIASQQFRADEAAKNRAFTMARAREEHLHDIAKTEMVQTLKRKADLDKAEIDYNWELKEYEAKRDQDLKMYLAKQQADKQYAIEKKMIKKRDLDDNEEALIKAYNADTMPANAFMAGMMALEFQRGGLSPAIARQLVEDYEVIYTDADVSQFLLDRQLRLDAEADEPISDSVVDTTVSDVTRDVLGVDFNDVVERGRIREINEADPIGLF